MEDIRRAFEEYLQEKVKIKDCPQKRIYESIEYSIMAGGKRIRPVLCMKMYERFSRKSWRKVMDFASAIEMIHTYSLIHDDLPAMDNDDYRRGKPTNHKVFKEDIAILAGDGLLNMAYETMLQNCFESDYQMRDRYMRASMYLAKAAGIEGMIGGQVVDVMSERPDEERIELDGELLEYIHINKTSKLIEASLVSGAIIGGAQKSEVEAVEKFGRAIGILFQIRDDILDKIGESEKLGKTAGIDERNNKLTYVSLYGLQESQARAEKLAEEAYRCLDKIGGDMSFFRELVDYSLTRES